MIVQARTKAPLDELKAEYPKQVAVLAGDASDFAISQQLANLAIEEFGQIDGLVFNHAVFDPATRLENAKAEDWRRHFDVNLFSAISLVRTVQTPSSSTSSRARPQCQATIPALRKSKGCIILTSTGAATRAVNAWGAYGASKAALVHLGTTLALEEPDICTLSIAPGAVDTEMQRELREVHSTVMAEVDKTFFHNIHKEGKLLKPEQPGNVFARIVLSPPFELSGKMMRYDIYPSHLDVNVYSHCVRWNDEKLEPFQDK